MCFPAMNSFSHSWQGKKFCNRGPAGLIARSVLIHDLTVVAIQWRPSGPRRTFGTDPRPDGRGYSMAAPRPRRASINASDRKWIGVAKRFDRFDSNTPVPSAAPAGAGAHCALAIA